MQILPQDMSTPSNKEISGAIITFIQKNPEMNNFFVLYNLMRDWDTVGDYMEMKYHDIIIPAMCEAKVPFVEYAKWWEAFCDKQFDYSLEEAQELIKKGMLKYITLFPWKFLGKDEWKELSQDSKYEEALDRCSFMAGWKFTNGNYRLLFEEEREFENLGPIMLEILEKYYS